MFVPGLKEIPPRGVTEISSSQQWDGQKKHNVSITDNQTEPFNKEHEGKQQLNCM